jgi:prepilin-type N-terminal cleavage/methylation domain-containing protein
MTHDFRDMSRRRRAYTLIEILVVIAIIAILAGMVMASVMAVRAHVPETTTRADILQISGALVKFKADYGVYPPDQLKLCMNRTDYGTTGLDKQSLLFLDTMFPGIDFVNVHWAGPGVTLPPGGVILEGDQVLVFCLGGPPTGASPPTLMGGFSKIPTDPIDVNNSSASRTSLYSFNIAGRLKLVPRAGNTAAAYFPSFIDGYNEMPYVYFSSDAGGRYSGAANTLGVSAYLQQNATTFQIISAGLDGQFGLGGVAWPPAQIGPGADDMTNFTDVKLGNAP